ncbi:MAG: alpha/beta fold hydrolase [Fuerstiella sp.]|nr:alpha/beta fold hydrolase [Fuerstiella sp.]
MSEFDRSVTAIDRTSVENPVLTVQPPTVLSGVMPFVPASGLCGGHRQTLVGAFLTGSPVFHRTEQHRVRVSDDDFVVLHDDRPDDWICGHHVVLMLHGLSGCHGSGYMMRIAARLNCRGVRSFRMDHRGCGAGEGLAKHPYHAGRINDLHRAVAAIENLCPGSSISIVGFSLSGNLLLRYLGDRSLDLSPNLFRAVAVCPPIELKHCVEQLDNSRAGRCYNSYFTRRLISQVSRGPQWRDHLPLARARQPPRRLYDFDDLFTAPASGFESADDYYKFASAGPYLDTIISPITILASEDDPLVSPEPFYHLKLPPAVTLCLTKHGGHLGYIGRRRDDPDRHWMDWRVIEWLLK